MLLVLLTWLVNYVVLKAAGKLTFKLLKTSPSSWFDELLTGYCLLTFLGTALSLFIPLNFIIHCILFAFSIAFLLLRPNFSFSQLKNLKASTIFITLFILLLAVPLPNHGDSSFYHAQALQWVEAYPAIPGLGNFFGRLAFNSSLFNIQALFSFYPIKGVSDHFLNSFIILIWMISLLQDSSEKTNTLAARALSVCFAFITLFITRGWVSSVAPDVMAGLFMLIISYKFISHQLFKQQLSLAFLLMLLFTAITIKVTTLFLLPLIGFYPLLKEKIRWSYLWIPFLILTPWFIRNIILSGYLIYPYLPLYVWQPDWQVPADMAFKERAWIASWARLPEQQWQYVLSLSFSQWFPLWLKNQYLVNKIILALFCGTLVFNVTHLLITLRKKGSVEKINNLIFVWCLVIILWFFTAPDFRFGYGLVLPCLLLAFFYYGRDRLHFKEIYIVVVKYAFISLLGVLMVYVLKKEKTDIQQTLILPEPYPEVKTVKQQIGNISINIVPGDGNCWNSAIPSVNDDLFNTGIRPRGNNLSDGFRTDHLE